MAEFIVALSEFDRTRLWAELGHRDLFTYLKRELGLSSGAAFYRKTAARLVQRFPRVIEPLRDGRLCLMSMAELAKVLTRENEADVLPRFFGRSRREAAAVAVELKPVESPPMREVVTQVTESVSRAAPDAAALASTPDFLPVECRAATPQPTVIAGFDRMARIEPLTAALRRVHFTTTQAFLDKLEAARNGMSHARPAATTEQVLEFALDVLLKEQARRHGFADRPLRKPRLSKSDHIPADVKRAVFLRDGGCCQWRVEAGGVCGSRKWIEYDHIDPKANGGLPTVENVRLLCRFHNQRSARLVFGDAWMDRFTNGTGVGEPVAVYRVVTLGQGFRASAPGRGRRSRPRSLRIRALVGARRAPAGLTRATASTP